MKYVTTMISKNNITFRSQGAANFSIFFLLLKLRVVNIFYLNINRLINHVQLQKIVHFLL